MADKLLDIDTVVKDFPLGRGRVLRAVDHVSFGLHRGEVLGLVGESGSGKSTLARIVARLIPQSSGSVRFNNRDISSISAGKFARTPARREVQMVFQDPLASLNPRWRAFDSIADPVRRLGTAEERGNVPALIEEAAEKAGFPKRMLGSYPHQLSGGQRARVDIARAIVLKPKLLILDEPTSALDASLQAHVVQTLVSLRGELDLTYIFVSHDLNLVRLISDQILVMRKGQLIESGPSHRVFTEPREAYTRELIAAIPVLGDRQGPAAGSASDTGCHPVAP